jgi:hypothetical protein
MPGPLFGFLIDLLQHAGKVLEAPARGCSRSVAASLAPACWRAPWPGWW